MEGIVAGEEEEIETFGWQQIVEVKEEAQQGKAGRQIADEQIGNALKNNLLF
jgi:hypothetical protein